MINLKSAAIVAASLMSGALLANDATTGEDVVKNDDAKSAITTSDVKATDNAALSVPETAGSFLSGIDVSPVVSMALSSGGETLGTVNFAYDDGSTSSRNIKAGGFWGVYGGVSIAFPDTSFSWQTLLGYHFDRESTDDGGISWKRLPIESLAIYETERWSFGAGINYSMKPTLKVAGQTTKFENALGPVIMVAFNGSYHSRFSLKMTKLQYDVILSQEELAYIELNEAIYGASYQPQAISGNTVSLSWDYIF